ncbi:hypothetical protein HDU81_009422 [Chytriomyces hyalinus]|nr:hypothetical protein HDU81_009422 [Chytriomyces hyalinus]
MFLYSIVIELVTGQTHHSSTSKSHPATIFSRLADSYRVGPSIKKMRRTGPAHGDGEDAGKVSENVDVMKDARLGRINIEWVDMNPSEENELCAVDGKDGSDGLNGPSALDEPGSGSSLMAIESVPVPFTWGRSQLNAGIVHLYRDRKELDTSQVKQNADSLNKDANKDASHPIKDIPSDTSVSPEQHLNVLCLLAVPAYMTAQDVLLFTAPFAASIQHVRFIRDAVHSRSMVLLNFRTGSAFEGEPAAFYSEYSGKLFNSLDEAVCTVVYVKSVEFKSHAIPYFDMNQPAASVHTGMIRSPKNTISPTNGSSSSLSVSASSSSSASPKLSIIAKEKSQLETSTMIELPTCPVCLDRMDSSVTGLVTILCHHSFHCNCLSKWQDASCPVCRYTSGGTQQFQLGANFHSRPGVINQYDDTQSRHHVDSTQRLLIPNASDPPNSTSFGLLSHPNSTHPLGNNYHQSEPLSSALDPFPPIQPPHEASDALLLPTSQHIPIPTTTATSNNTCSRCPATSNLWICLVCGTVGCGRYESAHAANHYTANPSHVYALELETQRVWDYVGDGYVHRLIRTGSDGRGIVELSAPAATAAGEYVGQGRRRRRRMRGPGLQEGVLGDVGVDSEFSVLSNEFMGRRRRRRKGAGSDKKGADETVKENMKQDPKKQQRHQHRHHHKNNTTDAKKKKSTRNSSCSSSNCSGCDGSSSRYSSSDDSEEALGLEYSLLLSHQLESQRHWFEEQMAAQAATNASLMEALRLEFQESMQVRVEAAHVEAAKQCRFGFNEEQKVWMRDRERLEKKLDKALDRMQHVERQFQEEREINDGLRENQDALKLQLAKSETALLEKGKQVEELTEQVRDLMFYLEAQQKVDASPLKNELQNGTVVLEQLPEPSTGGSASKSKGKKKRK